MIVTTETVFSCDVLILAFFREKNHSGRLMFHPAWMNWEKGKHDKMVVAESASVSYLVKRTPVSILKFDLTGSPEIQVRFLSIK
jgi:hypothetical protein